MDPEEVYTQMVAAARMVVEAGEGEMAAVLATDVLALDEWLRKGGFPPHAWDHHPTRSLQVKRLVADLQQMHKDEAIDLGLWPHAQAVVNAVTGGAP